MITVLHLIFASTLFSRIFTDRQALPSALCSCFAKALWSIKMASVRVNTRLVPKLKVRVNDRGQRSRGQRSGSKVKVKGRGQGSKVKGQGQRAGPRG